MIKILESINDENNKATLNVENSNDVDEKKEESINLSNDFSEALLDMCKAMEHILDFWDKEQYEDCLNNVDYPFSEPYDELLVNIYAWVKTAEKIYLETNAN